MSYTKTDYQQVYAARNRVKIQHKVYMHEALKNIAMCKSAEIFGNESVSEFLCYSGYVIAGKLGCKFDFLQKDDRNKIIQLHRAIIARQ